MKISARQYAESLAQSISSKSKPEMAVILDNFAKIMMENRDLNRLNEILSAFSKIWDKNQGELAVEFTGARAISEKTKKEIEEYLKLKTGAQKIVLTEKTDEDILGGLVLRYEDKVINASLKQSLQDLKNEMNK
ncbi:MAG: ATP synthase F1 subunit delta [Patescibacteria group bacterium]|nr:ATP synthase F1 subunit delta [Patescibacteria group bacterium]MDD5164267.1 ATP synthase F1 subunit delta [Patescibacteria group bacterium]MDD5535053.1 ATP synthase F1 subunit delta [Patescibacteria group bacterium]